jgi:hypothetical protein
MRIVTLLLALFFATEVGAADREHVDSVYGPACRTGPHKQPGGPFAVYVFCDDALGTNIAVMYADLGDPRFEKWTLTRRFWQDEAWAADVHDLGWVPGRNLLVVTTSVIYGGGATYLLELERQTFAVLYEPGDCGSHIIAINASSVTLRLNNCISEEPDRQVVVRLPQSNPSLQGAPLKRRP